MEKINRDSKEAKSLSLMSSTIEMVEKYPNHSYGLEGQPFSFKVDSMLTILCDLTQYSLPELRNYFTVEEAAALCDMKNGTMNSTQISPKRSLMIGFEDSCDYEGLDEKWSIDRKVLLNKLENITEFQAYLVELLTTKFWDDCTGSFTMQEIADLFLIDYDEPVTIEPTEAESGLYNTCKIHGVDMEETIELPNEDYTSRIPYNFKYWATTLAGKELVYVPVYANKEGKNVIFNSVTAKPTDTVSAVQAKVDFGVIKQFNKN